MDMSKFQPTGMVPNEELDQDPRNLAYDQMVVFGGEIPKQGEVYGRLPEILNQNQSHSCTLHSTVGAVHQISGELLSPRYGYWRIKTDKKYPSSLLPYGAHMKDSVSVLINEGICDYELLPNENTDTEEGYLNVSDSNIMHENAKKNAGGTYLYATLAGGTTAIFDAVVKYMWEQKQPVKVGVRWYQEYNNARKGGVIPAVWATSQWAGHDMCAVEWKEINGEPYLGFLQSWGDKWGDEGKVWMPRNYSYFYSPIAVIPSLKAQDLEIKKPIPLAQSERNKHKERANAQELTALTEVKFPKVGDPKANGQNAIARSIFGKEKLVFINAVCYLGWTFTDIINHLYARSRSKIDDKAFKLDFTLKRGEQIK